MEEKKLLTENELDANGGTKYAFSEEFVPVYQASDYTKSGAAEELYAGADAADSEGRRYYDLRRWNQADEAALGFVSAGMVNPEDIENFTVLKDASAAQIGRMRGFSSDGVVLAREGGNGVVIVTKAGDQAAFNVDTKC